jgi:glycosyltransferase involved in cell wall biosynthesis
MKNQTITPDISIVIPCYNDGKTLVDCLDSIPFKNDKYAIEVIVVDDGSDDPETINILPTFSPDIKVVHQAHQGVTYARNTGIELAKGKYILPLDADNKITPDFIAKSIDILNKNAEISIVYTDAFLFGEEEGIRKTGEFNINKLLKGNYIDTCAVFRKEVWDRAGGYDNDLNGLAYEDWEFWLNAYTMGFKFFYISEPLYYYRTKVKSRNKGGINPEIRYNTVLHIVHKHQKLFSSYWDETIASLHAIIAYWEGAKKDEFDDKISSLQFELRTIEDRLKKELETVIKNYDNHINNIEAGWKSEREEILKIHHQREIELQCLHETEREKIVDVYTNEIKNFQSVVDTLKNDIEIQKNYANQLSVLIQQYEQRIQKIENSKTWKLRKNFYKMKGLFRSAGKRGKGIPGLGLIKRIIFFLFGKGQIIMRRFFKKIFRTLYLWLEEVPVRIIPISQLHSASVASDPYQQWMMRNFPREAEFRQYKKDCEQFVHKPLISILLPVYNPPVEFFKATLNSVIGQIYENWELCIADDASTDKRIKKIIEEYAEKDFRIKTVFRKENGHISKCSNSALELTTGEYTLLLDHDDILTQDCLVHVANAINQNIETDLIYSDEDKVDENGQHSVPHFKPQWCPDHFSSRNYLGHVVVCRTSILKEIGGFRVGFEGSQDYDMLLRFTEKTQRITHIPKVLYHWRIHQASAARSEEAKPYAYHAAQKALTESLAKRGEPATVGFLAGFRGYSIRYQLLNPGKVSIIIPNKDNAEVLETCIKSIFEKSSWNNFEVIVVNNNSTEKSLFDILNKYKKTYPDQFNWFDYNIPFNFSKLVNAGVEKSTGDYIVLLNNDTEVITSDWMEAMMEQAQRKSIGAVGVKLLYFNDTIQHAGVVIGLGGIAGHTFVGAHKDEAGYFNYIQSINNYSAITAACLMVEKQKYLELKGFDENFEVEYNDVDFCLRLKDSGLNNVYLPHVELYHYESLTRGHPHMSKESYERHISELNKFKIRWQKYIDDDPCYNPNLTRGAHDFSLSL